MFQHFTTIFFCSSFPLDKPIIVV